MKIGLAQTRYKTGNFQFNFEQIIEQIENTDCDLLIFPECNIDSLGGKDLAYDEKCCNEQINFYNLLASKKIDKAILLGDILIHEGEIKESDNGFFIIYGKNVYVNSIYRDDVICDLYVLAKNKYFVKDDYFEFIDSIHTRNNFVYVNTVCMADENIFAGNSFAKNKENELVKLMPLCESACELINFDSPITYPKRSMEENIYKVITYALKEYCENTKINKVILGLSGGIDSALVATLATDAIGCENVLGILMPSMYSSQGSITDSIELAHNLGIKTEKHSITPLFENFMEKIAHEKNGSLAEENLQARLRALILMFFSNRDGSLLLTTSNKSESAMGFGTLYGDLAGGLNIICDLTKTNVYKLSNYINRNGEIIPQAIIDKAPSAELRPNQKDQDRLPPYEILDDIIEMYLEQNKSFEEMYAKYDKAIVDDIIKKIYRFQYKRKQCCLGVRLSERSFAKGVELPILQGFY